MANTVRIDCNAPGFEDSWIEHRVKWTRGQSVRWDALTDDAEIVATLASQAAACHIVVTPTLTVDSPSELTVDAFYEMDEVLASWLVTTIARMVASRRVLGNVSASVSYNTNGETVRPTPTKTSEK